MKFIIFIISIMFVIPGCAVKSVNQTERTEPVEPIDPAEGVMP